MTGSRTVRRPPPLFTSDTAPRIVELGATPTPMKTLAALYCEQRRVRPADFSRHVLRRCLYPGARMFSLPLSLLPDYFAADLELIEATGRLTRATGFPAEVAEYHYHPANLGRLRRDWRLRLSVTRLQQIVDELLPDEVPTTDSLAPFAEARIGVLETPKPGPATVASR